ncbi:Hypothetical protein FKW44_018269, partial [Caligus rogercresseyi]
TSIWTLQDMTTAVTTGKKLIQRWKGYYEEFGLQLQPTGPTFRPNGVFKGENRTSTIDHVYLRGNTNIHVQVLDDTLSDHVPLLATISSERAPKLIVKETREECNWSTLDVPALELFLLNWDWQPLFDSSNVNDINLHIKTAITAVLDVAAPLRRYTPPNANVRLQPYTRAVMRERDKAKSRGKKCYKALRNKALSLVRRDH